ncbi:alanine--tRNA ligase [Buchnera aphidicola]|uniref:Alanine--tRNA ligase n=1 Tax=Buchnera aphidicola (Sarucallis kahawaluokalani) TaxID=1241878 RepID=A0A4D6YD80_9GAMM|nr:alanine--tRNA ligase [Buchnera aphidicola]QCI26063.1 alanine--tRNA ligase [Buchnera aphidicola (Sarucallis kahawaluokalani)]
MKYTTKIIRKMFLNFFKNNQHNTLPSSSLIPDTTSNLLFTNAGMNQFQDIFLGKKKHPYSRITTIQKCLRTGGKHNDFDQVGYSEYHHTFFEMLGNFSFGGYCKKEAISYAWKLLTHPKWFNIPKKKLFVTVYYEDYESYNIWNQHIKLSKKNIIKIYDKNNQTYESDNFWQMGNTGPCGPCTEIFFKKKKNNGNYDLNDKTQCIEIWNIVFIQFNKITKNKIIPLENISIDTGMGLERIASILQNVSSNYKIDIFKEIINYICEKNNLKFTNHPSLNIMADHVRAAVFIIYEKITPSNEGRGYILRRIIRRALLHSNKLGIQNNFLHKLVNIVIQTAHEKKKDLQIQKKYIMHILQEEENQFNTTLNNGINFLKKKINNLKEKYLDPKIIFYLYDTLGFPIDLTQDICKEHHILIDQHQLKNFIQEIKQKRKEENKKYTLKNIIYTNCKSKFCGYKKYKITTTVKKIFINGEEKKKILPFEEGVFILHETPFFGESGGQIGDTGIIYNNENIFQVKNTQNFSDTIGHIGKLSSGKIYVNDIVTAEIDIKKRLYIKNNHTTTHLLHATLKKILTYPIQQKGSFIDSKYLRFDFTYPYKILPSMIEKIEILLNQYIQENIPIQVKDINFDIAKKNYIFLHNKTYPPIVRTITIKNISKEICKGTHVKQTGTIGIARIRLYKNISTGIKRIEVITGIHAIKKIQEQNKKMQKIQYILKTDNSTLIPKIQKIIQYYEQLKKKYHHLNKILIQNEIKKIIEKLKIIQNNNYIIQKVNVLDNKSLKILINHIKSKIDSGIIILFYKNYEKYVLMINITENLLQKIQATKIITLLKKYTNTVGGGNSEMAQCIMQNITNIKNIMKHIESWIINKIKK